MSQSHRVALMISALLLAGCGATTPDVLEVTLELSGTAVAAGDSIVVDVVGRNRGIESVEVSGSRCPQLFDVLASDGSVVGPELVACPLIAVAPERLDPGEEFRATYVWRRQAQDGSRLPAGTYHLRGTVTPLSGEPIVSDPVAVQVSS